MNIFERRQPCRREFSPFGYSFWDYNPFLYDGEMSDEETSIPVYHEHERSFQNPSRCEHMNLNSSTKEKATDGIPIHHRTRDHKLKTQRSNKTKPTKRAKATEIPITITHEHPAHLPSTFPDVDPTLIKIESGRDQECAVEVNPESSPLKSKSVNTKNPEEPKEIDFSSSQGTVARKARETIERVMEDFEKSAEDVESFEGTPKDKTYLRLEHELTNKLLTLDNVSAIGTPEENDIRAYRKEAIKQVQCLLDKLEAKVE